MQVIDTLEEMLYEVYPSQSGDLNLIALYGRGCVSMNYLKHLRTLLNSRPTYSIYARDSHPGTNCGINDLANTVLVENKPSKAPSSSRHCPTQDDSKAP